MKSGKSRGFGSLAVTGKDNETRVRAKREFFFVSLPFVGLKSAASIHGILYKIKNFQMKHIKLIGKYPLG